MGEVYLGNDNLRRHSTCVSFGFMARELVNLQNNICVCVSCFQK